MELDQSFIIVFCTCPTQEVAEEIATQVVSNSLAGCVNILNSVTSIYRWLGKIEKEQEKLLIIKTHRDIYPQLQELIKKMHPYQVPEVIATSINYGSVEYLAWLKDNLIS